MMKLSLSKKLYTKESVERTINLFNKNKLANLDLEIDKNQYIISFKQIDEEFNNIIVDEFCNFLIAEMKKNHEGSQLS